MPSIVSAPRQRHSFWRHIWPAIVVLVGFFLGLAVAHRHADLKPLPQTLVYVGSWPFQVEVAADEGSRERGLMFRKTLPPGRGMLFVFEHPAIQQFWMKNTLIPLDILFFDDDARLIGMAANTPPCPPNTTCLLYASPGPASYALEIGAGEAARLGLTVGAQLQLPR